MNYRIMFLRDKAQRPIGCLAIKADRKDDKLFYGFSVLNPADKFDRKVARQLALGRLMESPTTLKMSHKDLNMHEISCLIMKNLSRNRNAPARASRAAKLWLNLHLFQ